MNLLLLDYEMCRGQKNNEKHGKEQLDMQRKKGIFCKIMIPDHVIFEWEGCSFCKNEKETQLFYLCKNYMLQVDMLNNNNSFTKSKKTDFGVEARNKLNHQSATPFKNLYFT